jgi:hypothetical protein
VNDLVLSAESNLQQVQTQIQQLGHTDSLLDQERGASAAYEDALNRQ